jgi:alcohol dehydrogenase class IV
LIVLDDGRRLGILSPNLIPKVAICDPTMTLCLPPDLTADTGMDAITHCIETYTSSAYNPPADGIALDGLRRAAANIQQAVEKGSDLEARREMMAAAMNGALAFQKGLGGVHAMSHALGGPDGLEPRHGALNAILLPYMLEFNAPAVGHRYGALKHAMGLGDSADLPAEMFKMTERLGLPVRLGEIGIDEAAVDRAAVAAEKDYTNRTNPRHARTADYRYIMRAAL